MHISNHLPKTQDIFSSIGLPFRSLVFEQLVTAPGLEIRMKGTAPAAPAIVFFEAPKTVAQNMIERYGGMFAFCPNLIHLFGIFFWPKGNMEAIPQCFWLHVM